VRPYLSVPGNGLAVPVFTEFSVSLGAPVILAPNIRGLSRQKLRATFDSMAGFFDKAFHVYMTASTPRGVIYVGMTSDLPGRAWHHRERAIDGFTKRFWVGRLVYFEPHETASSAQRREWLMKRWRRTWKIELIEAGNPTWADLYPEALRLHGFEP
jgi:putative endonuclease